jgi:hypothetical protein
MSDISNIPVEDSTDHLNRLALAMPEYTWTVYKPYNIKLTDDGGYLGYQYAKGIRKLLPEGLDGETKVKIQVTQHVTDGKTNVEGVVFLCNDTQNIPISGEIDAPTVADLQVQLEKAIHKFSMAFMVLDMHGLSRSVSH